MNGSDLKFWDKPCAIDGLTSYRYRGRYGWIMLGATSHEDALCEARRSVSYEVERRYLQVWSGSMYVHVE